MTKIKKTLQDLANPTKAKHSQGFFRTGKGEYGEGDKFLGITVPEQRKVAKQFKDATQKDLETLLSSPWHEHRLTALFIMVLQFKKEPEKIFKLYMKNTHNVNNWDLVDSSAYHIVGAYLEDKDRSLLIKLAKSKLLWERRIAMVACYHFIKVGETTDTLKIANLLTNDTHDLMHKAVGWMLREMGKKNLKALHGFLDTHAKTMPRTMLRYAIERLPEAKRKHYLNAKTRA